MQITQYWLRGILTKWESWFGKSKALNLEKLPATGNQHCGINKKKKLIIIIITTIIIINKRKENKQTKQNKTNTKSNKKLAWHVSRSLLTGWLIRFWITNGRVGGWTATRRLSDVCCGVTLPQPQVCSIRVIFWKTKTTRWRIWYWPIQINNVIWHHNQHVTT